MIDDVRFDWQRAARTRVPEVVLAEHKSTEQLLAIASHSVQMQQRLFMTRVPDDKAQALHEQMPNHVHVHAESSTVFVGDAPLSRPLGTPKTLTGTDHDDQALGRAARVAVVAAGTSDAPVVAEIEQSLWFLGADATRYVDVGVAGLWRLTELADELASFPIVIAVAGMEGALFSVLAGLVPAPVIAVPTSVGYGVGKGGTVALQSALSSCAPGIAVVNIDNGFGAAALAVKMLSITSKC